MSIWNESPGQMYYSTWRLLGMVTSFISFLTDWRKLLRAQLTLSLLLPQNLLSMPCIWFMAISRFHAPKHFYLSKEPPLSSGKLLLAIAQFHRQIQKPSQSQQTWCTLIRIYWQNIRQEYLEIRKADDCGEGRKAGERMRLRKEQGIQQATKEGVNTDYQHHSCKPVSFGLGNTGTMKKLLRKTEYNPETEKQTQSNRNTLAVLTCGHNLLDADFSFQKWNGSLDWWHCHELLQKTTNLKFEA